MSKSEDLQKHFEVHGIKPEKKIDIDGIQIYLADSGVHHDIKDRGFNASERDQFSLGYYMTVWAIGVGDKLYGYLPIFFEAMHDIRLTDRKLARLNAAEKEARAFIKEGLKKGLFNAQS
jgi:hypothetical protein